MLLNKGRIFSNDRVCRATLGVTKDEFDALLPMFHACLVAYRHELHPKRVRKVGGGRRGDLPTDEDKLAYILMYLKIYPTYDVLSVLADHQRSKCGDSVKLLLPVLERTLGRHLVLPERKARSLEEVFERNPELKDVFLDGAERPVQKPRGQKRKNRLYSGKKKATTRKTVIIADGNRKILFMTKTKSGRRHDKRIIDKSDVVAAIPDRVTAWADTGFQGIERLHPNTMRPLKATKNNPLTEAQKQNNRIISGLRIVVEHAIAGYKRFKAASDIYRNKLPNMDDLMTAVAIGLWNFHLRQSHLRQTA